MPSAFAAAAERADRAIIRRNGIVATHTPVTGPVREYTEPLGVLELPDGNFEDDLAEYTRFFTRPADWDTAPAKRDRLLLEGATYIVTDTRAQEEGAVRLILDKQD